MQICRVKARRGRVSPLFVISHRTPLCFLWSSAVLFFSSLKYLTLCCLTMEIPASACLVHGWKASWLCGSPQRGPLHHPPTPPHERQQHLELVSAPLVLASGSLVGCSPADQHQAPFPPTLNCPLGFFLSLSFSDSRFLSASSFVFFTLHHLLPMFLSIFP